MIDRVAYVTERAREYGLTVEEAAATYRGGGVTGCYERYPRNPAVEFLNPQGNWVCTRARGHGGPHVAHRTWSAEGYPVVHGVGVLEIWDEENFFTLLDAAVRRRETPR